MVSCILLKSFSARLGKEKHPAPWGRGLICNSNTILYGFFPFVNSFSGKTARNFYVIRSQSGRVRLLTPETIPMAAKRERIELPP